MPLSFRPPSTPSVPNQRIRWTPSTSRRSAPLILHFLDDDCASLPLSRLSLAPLHSLICFLLSTATFYFTSPLCSCISSFRCWRSLSMVCVSYSWLIKAEVKRDQVTLCPLSAVKNRLAPLHCFLVNMPDYAQRTTPLKPLLSCLPLMQMT